VDAAGDVFVAGEDLVSRIDGSSGALVWSAVVPTLMSDIVVDPAGDVLVTGGLATTVKLHGADGAELWRHGTGLVAVYRP